MSFILDGWNEVSLGSLADSGVLSMRSGYAHGGHSDSSTAGVPHLRPFNVTEEGLVSLARVKYVPPPPEDSPQWLRRGDVLFNNTNSEELTGKTALFDRDVRCTASNHMTVIRVHKARDIDPAWLAYFLQHLWHQGAFRRLLRRYVAQATVALGRLKDLEIPLLDRSEQRAIAHVLRTVQRAKEQTDQVIAATRSVISSLIDQVFGTQGLGSNLDPDPPALGFRSIAARTGLRKLADLCHPLEYGLTATATEDPIGPRFLRISDIQGGVVRWEAVPYCHCSAQERERYKLSSGDLLIARIGATTGKSYLVSGAPGECVFASYLIRVRPLSQLDPTFLSYFTQSRLYWSQIDAAKGGRLKTGVNAPVLRSLRIPVPPMRDQQA